MKHLFENKNIFKLILGAGNEDIESIKRLVQLYSDAGADIFDLRADKNIIKEVSKILDNNCDSKKRYICASIALGGDIHIQKARINSNCVNCKKCIKACHSKAIELCKNRVKINKQKCIGCKNCENYCNAGAIEFYSENKDHKRIFNDIKDEKVDYIEVHACSNPDKIIETFKFLKQNFEGELGICISGDNFSKIEKIQIITKIKQLIAPRILIVQADGSSMSGFDNEKKTTQKAIEAAKLILENIDRVYVIPSGGTNAQTAQLANKQNLQLNGVAIGSFARMIVSDYIQRNDFYSEKIYNQALKLANELVLEIKNL